METEADPHEHALLFLCSGGYGRPTGYTTTVTSGGGSGEAQHNGRAVETNGVSNPLTKHAVEQKDNGDNGSCHCPLLGRKLAICVEQ